MVKLRLAFFYFFLFSLISLFCEEVQVLAKPGLPLTSDEIHKKPTLRLEAAIEGSHSLYPGQRTKLLYRYYFSGDIALSTEKLPLLDADGLIKIGEKEIHDSVHEGLNIREIVQEVEAIKPGLYTFGPSLIEGYAFKEDLLGKPIYTSEKLTSQAAAVELNVKPFPLQNQPASFNGAVGEFTFKTSLKTASEMIEGDELSLLLEISGNGNLKNISSPDLCCQPGYSGFFKLSDLPPAESVEGGTKKILVKMRAQTPLILSIPSIEFSYFDPETSNYSILTSEPISFSVKPFLSSTDKTQASENEGLEKQSVKDALFSTFDEKEFQSPQVFSSEIEGIMPLTSADLYNLLFGSWWSLAIIPFGLFLLIYQRHLKEYLEWKKRENSTVTSQRLFLESFSEGKNKRCDFEKLKKSFKLALVEAGLLESLGAYPNHVNLLPDEEIFHEVQHFLLTLDENRFSGKEFYDFSEIYQLSLALMNKIQSAGKKTIL